MLTKTPVAASTTTSEDPPKDRNGSGMPVSGITPTTPPMLMKAWQTIQHVSPAASKLANGSVGPRRDPDPDPAEAREGDEHQAGADHPELVADDGEDEVGLRVRQEAPGCNRAPDAGAREVTRTERNERLHDLVAARRGVREGVDERQQSVAAIRTPRA